MGNGRWAKLDQGGELDPGPGTRDDELDVSVALVEDELRLEGLGVGSLGRARVARVVECHPTFIQDDVAGGLETKIPLPSHPWRRPDEPA